MAFYAGGLAGSSGLRELRIQIQIPAGITEFPTAHIKNSETFVFRWEVLMFESAQGRSEASSSRLGAGAIVSGFVHALVAGLVFIIPGKTKAQQENTPAPVIVEFVAPKPAGGGSPGPAQPAPKEAAPAPKPKPAQVRIPDKPVPEQETQPETPPQTSETQPGTDTGGSNPPGGGEGGGSGTGSGSGTGGNGPGSGNGASEPAPTYTVINWNSKMERPVLIGGPAQPEYPRNAMLQHREGTVIARCLIATDGAVRDCHILSGDVMLQDAALDALKHQRYRPVIFEGAPVSVWYMFRFTFKLQ